MEASLTRLEETLKWFMATMTEKMSEMSAQITQAYGVGGEFRNQEVPDVRPLAVEAADLVVDASDVEVMSAEQGRSVVGASTCQGEALKARLTTPTRAGLLMPMLDAVKPPLVRGCQDPGEAFRRIRKGVAAIDAVGEIDNSNDVKAVCSNRSVKVIVEGINSMIFAHQVFDGMVLKLGPKCHSVCEYVGQTVSGVHRHVLRRPLALRFVGRPPPEHPPQLAVLCCIVLDRQHRIWNSSGGDVPISSWEFEACALIKGPEFFANDNEPEKRDMGLMRGITKILVGICWLKRSYERRYTSFVSMWGNLGIICVILGYFWMIWKAIKELVEAEALMDTDTVVPEEHNFKFHVAVFTDIILDRAYEFNDYCLSQQPSVPLIKAEVHGLSSRVCCDFGPRFIVLDVDGEDPFPGIVAWISTDNHALISFVDDEQHEFQDGDLLIFSEVQGMSELTDGKSRGVKNARPFSFSMVEDTHHCGVYTNGGIITQVKEPRTLQSKNLRCDIREPGDFPLSDLSSFGHPLLLHLAFQALDQLLEEVGRYPVASGEPDANRPLIFATSIKEVLVGCKHERWLRQFASSSGTEWIPMAAMFVGIVDREVVKVCSRKFHPLCQLLYFDSVDFLPTYAWDSQNLKQLSSQYDAQISVFGSKLQKKLQAANIFVVRSGALGF